MSNGQPDITYQAAYSAEDQEVTLIQDRRAGVCGPLDDFPAHSLQAAERSLFDAGYLLASPWGERTSNGDRWCRLTPMA